MSFSPHVAFETYFCFSVLKLDFCMFQSGGCLKRKNMKDKTPTPLTKVTLVENSDCRDLKRIAVPQHWRTMLS